MSFMKALNKVITQMVLSYTIKFYNPANWLSYQFAGKVFNVTAHQRRVAQNARKIRDFVNDYVQKRKRGENKSELAEGSDLLSVFLSAPPEIFTDEFIIDELVDFFMAASGTTNLATRTMVAHFAKCPESL